MTPKSLSASRSGSRKEPKKVTIEVPPERTLSPPVFVSFHPHEEVEHKEKNHELDPDEVAICDTLGIEPHTFVELREVFRLVDKDGGGTISKDELQLLMQTLGLRVSKEELEAMVNEIVADAEEIDLQSFIQAMSRKIMPSQPMNVLLDAFRHFDEGGYTHMTGRINTKDLIYLMVHTGSSEHRIKPEEVEDLIGQIAPRALEDGFFDYSNYLSMLFSE